MSGGNLRERCRSNGLEFSRVRPLIERKTRRNSSVGVMGFGVPLLAHHQD